MENHNIFALDIGTRTVIGLIIKNSGENLEVVAQHVETHQDRAMKDGQIHDVNKVAAVVKKVKENLEKRSKTKLTSAAIAAAGRTLRTVRGSATQDFSNISLINHSHIQQVEVEALVRCKNEIAKLFPDEPLYCVGYSILTQKLNNYNIDTLEGQKGGLVEMEIIATFLPNIVIDSLFEVLKKVDLAIESLTLEPIAAMEIAIPPRFRMLNLALVDIGAGTSDIAISKGGTIIGYKMVQKAGDLITEAVAGHYLIDFQTAEELKITLSRQEKANITDILGIAQEITRDSFNTAIEMAVSDLADDISKEIIDLNGKPPSAVFCVGGGSQVGLLREKLANNLSLPLERVAVRDRETLENVKFKNTRTKSLRGPEIVTPLGIGAIAKKKAIHHFITVYVNEKEVTLFNAKRTTVAQGLFSAGVKVEDILKGGMGKDIKYKIQGEEIVIKGTRGFPGEIYLNNKKATLDDKVVEGDSITVIFPHNPQNALMLIKDVIKPYKKYVAVNHEKVSVIDEVLVNGINVSEEYNIKTGDQIEFIYKLRLHQLNLGINFDEHEVYFDGEIITGNPSLTGVQEITYKKKQQDSGTKLKNISVNANGQEIIITKENPLVVDVFDKLNFDISNPKGVLVIKKNGLESNFAESVVHHDKIEIHWN
ncbi:hypothetical protein HYG86_10520 [Alkalicella caledoniensis]|uniref:SHS2 domain-containing protein n=1 Tax=Alkalicella caledoniensis TaxID=2731377 RepID=A0A7G9W902_ALKCA|nr:cell division FtsA domain-containing protein [Alkalicella caledoniensis]QNO15164.1 hypothetical protein HYG86_10520 [Alkalicella caledoniensis]